MYGTMIAKEVGWTSAATQFKVSLGGLLHDIGKKEIDRSILEKPRRELTAKEQEIYETHPMRGKEILAEVPSIPTDIALVALHHHENLLGRGYPARLKKDQIHPLSRLISVANRFCELALKGPNSEPLSPTEAIDKLMAYHQNELEPAFVVGLMKIFKYPVPPQMSKAIDNLKKFG
jgi:HD-GYP domain-containing protein (c-di-GMP phosphodiesterase class II)